MDNINIRKKQLMRLLKENNCYIKFINNFFSSIYYMIENEKGKNPINELVYESFNNNNNAKEFYTVYINERISNEIARAFNWHLSNESWDFWNGVSYDWSKILEYERKNKLKSKNEL